MSALTFTVSGFPRAQGSMIASVRGGRAFMRPASNKMLPWRKEVTRCAVAALTCDAPMFGKHVPVRMMLEFTFTRPPSAKKRVFPVVAPDLDKLTRLCGDALTNVVYVDDAQVVEIVCSKVYGEPEGVRISVNAL